MNNRFALIFFLAPFGFAADSNEPHYAGAEVCGSCHQEIAASQANTAMAKTWHGVNTSLRQQKVIGSVLRSKFLGFLELGLCLFQPVQLQQCFSQRPALS